jgi:hypothetical protein
MAKKSYLEMIKTAIKEQDTRGGSSMASIRNYLYNNFEVAANPKVVNTAFRAALKRGLDNGEINLTKGTGAAAYFALGTGRTPRGTSETTNDSNKSTKKKATASKGMARMSAKESAPRKATVAKKNSAPAKKRGRPKKITTSSAPTTATKKRAAPKAKTTSETNAAPAKKRGRPKKNTDASEKTAPKKTTAAQSKTITEKETASKPAAVRV